MNSLSNRRILVIDDMPSIHEDFRKALAIAPISDTLEEIESTLFDVPAQRAAAGFDVDSAYQGREGVAMVGLALQADRPYAMAFVDMRMPAGWDGVETIEHLWRIDPQVQVVICTAYSDHSWDEVLTRLDVRDQLLILKKPFDTIEVRQLANTLTVKWDLTRMAALKMDTLEEAVQERTRELSRTNDALQTEITERKQLESRLVQSEKLASIGQLAAGVAHEINNPLGFIFSNFNTLEKYIEDLFEMLNAYERAEHSLGSSEIAAQLKSTRERLELAYLMEDIPQLMMESKGGVARVSKIVQDLKDFSRVDSDNKWLWVNLHAGIDSTLNIVASETRYTADVVKEYGVIPEVECLPSQINQVIMNLVVNAAHATGPARGLITVRTGTEGEHVWIEVADRGSGIPEDVLPRIFDPFFTTKEIGKGTGLGLSLSYGIVQKHNGRIDVQTEVGKGTTFRVVLPIRQMGA